jgi:hypothetical protein
MTKKYIIGLGCSWTQGEGGWTDEVMRQYPEGRVQIAHRGKDDYHLRKMEHENSWVNVLCRDYFPDHTPMNLGIKGIGNEAAVRQLHFCNRIDWDNSTGIIVLMLSGFERWCMFNPRIHPGFGQDDFYSNNEIVHNKWRTAWPNDNDAVTSLYARELWSEQFVSGFNMMALLELQTFAKAHNFKVVVANAFNDRQEGLVNYLRNNIGSLVDTFDWESTYVHNTTSYVSMMQHLVGLDDLIPREHWAGYYQFYRSRSWPAKYLTNCDGAHPTIEGYKAISEELAKFIRVRGYA